MSCPKCGKSVTTETRREHAAAVLAGTAIDETQKAMVAAGVPLPPVECPEDHDHPNLKEADGTTPVRMKGIADDVRDVCPHCGFFGLWRKPDAAAA